MAPQWHVPVSIPGAFQLSASAQVWRTSTMTAIGRTWSSTLRPETFRNEREQMCLFFGRRGTHPRELNPIELDVRDRPRRVFVKVEIRIGLAVEAAGRSLDER